jgi:hypothetical protein
MLIASAATIVFCARYPILVSASHQVPRHRHRAEPFCAQSNLDAHWIILASVGALRCLDAVAHVSVRHASDRLKHS